MVPGRETLVETWWTELGQVLATRGISIGVTAQTDPGKRLNALHIAAEVSNLRRTKPEEPLLLQQRKKG